MVLLQKFRTFSSAATIAKNNASTLGTSASSSINEDKFSKMTFGRYLEGRESFLTSIGRSDRKTPSKEAQTRMQEILNSTGSIKKEVGGVSKTAGIGIGGCSDFEPNSNADTTRDINTIRQMMACSMHLGHATSRWNPKMAPYIYGERAGIHIIDLERTLVCLRQACNVVKDIANRGGSIVFVGTSEAIQRLTYEAAQDCGQFYINKRWVGGTITNKNQVLRNDKLTPDLLVILDPHHNGMAVKEAIIGDIPTVAICDTNFNPTQITYPIPANDDAYTSVELVAKTLSLAALEGRRLRTTPQDHNQQILESATRFIDKVFTRDNN